MGQRIALSASHILTVTARGDAGRIVQVEDSTIGGDITSTHTYGPYELDRSFELLGGATYSIAQAPTGYDPIARSNVESYRNYATAYAVPIQPRSVALVTTPTVTALAASAGTLTTPYNTAGSVDRTKFSWRGGDDYIRPSGTFPYSGFITLQQPPVVPMGFGSAAVEFVSDDPLPIFYHIRGNSVQTRISVDSGSGFQDVCRVMPATTSGTAAAGAASTITLAAEASATNGLYTDQFIRIMSGTGAGQIRQITGYVGATKVATVKPVWTTAPDATSTYEMGRSYFNWTNANTTGDYISIDWSGERRFRTYRVEHAGQGFYGVYLSSVISSIFPAPRTFDRQCFWSGDSFSAGTGASLASFSSMAYVACSLLGWELCNVSIGGAGDLNPGASVPAPQRLLPGANSWFVKMSGTVTGSFTITQGAVTVTVNRTDTQAQIQTSLDTAFGSGAYTVIFSGAASQQNYWFLGNGATGELTTPMTANFAGLTGANTGIHAPSISQYLGEIERNLYRRPDGTIPPFEIVLANGHNDTSSSGFAAADLQTAVTSLITRLKAKYPMASITVVGNMYVPPSGAGAASVTDANSARLAAATAAAGLINGSVPFIQTLAWVGGAGGYHGNQVGTGNTDVWTDSDAVHPSEPGHEGYGRRLAYEIQALRGVFTQ